MRATATVTRRRSQRCPQRGTTLVEALLAFTLLALGVLSMSKLHLHLQAHADLARQRSDAVRLAQQDIESLRSFSVLQMSAGAAAGHIAYDQIDDASATIDALNGAPLTTSFQLTRQIDDSPSTGLKAATVGVAWTARDGSAQQAILHAAIAGQNPAFTGALGVRPGTLSAATAYARARGIPLDAQPLGDGRSARKPTAASTTAYVFDNASGEVTHHCSGVPSAVSTANLTAAHLADCTEWRGLWLSGTVRFSNATPPDLSTAHDTPLDLALSLTRTDTSAPGVPVCSAEAQKTVQYASAEGTRRAAVPLTAQPGEFGVTAWTELGDRFVAYHCVVAVSDAAPTWSGVSAIVPLGWTLGASAADRKVCRHTADLDGSGSIDRNDEHPAAYAAVDRALQQQNFVVIRGDQACPAVTAARMGATMQHQP